MRASHVIAAEDFDMGMEQLGYSRVFLPIQSDVALLPILELRSEDSSAMAFKMKGWSQQGHSTAIGLKRAR
jgi:hypothetical protein